MKFYGDAESGYLEEPEVTGYVGSRMRDVEVIRVSGDYVIARGRRYGRHWLLKGLREELRGSTAMHFRLMKEFEVHSRLAHQNVVQAVGFEDIDGLGDCIIEEWIEGKTLREYLQRGVLSKKERRSVMGEIIEAAAYLHSRGVVHRDLKPSNIMVRDAGGEVVIIDFGLADTDDYAELKQAAGTEGFISPEQKEHGGARTSDDVYSLGAIMRELCPEYGRLAKRCTSDRGLRPKDAGELLKKFNKRDRLPKIIWITVIITLFLLLVGALTWRMLSLGESAQNAENRVAVLAKENERNQNRVTELQDSLTQVKSKMNETAQRLAEGEKVKKVKESASEGVFNEIDMILHRYDRDIISSITPDNPEALPKASARLMDELKDVTERYCDRLRKAGLSTQEETEFNSEVTYYYHNEYSKYQEKWLKRIYPGWNGNR